MDADNSKSADLVLEREGQSEQPRAGTHQANALVLLTGLVEGRQICLVCFCQDQRLECLQQGLLLLLRRSRLWDLPFSERAQLSLQLHVLLVLLVLLFIEILPHEHFGQRCFTGRAVGVLLNEICLKLLNLLVDIDDLLDLADDVHVPRLLLEDALLLLLLLRQHHVPPEEPPLVLHLHVPLRSQRRLRELALPHLLLLRLLLPRPRSRPRLLLHVVVHPPHGHIVVLVRGLHALGGEDAVEGGGRAVGQRAIEEEPSGGRLVEDVDGVQRGVRELALPGLPPHQRSDPRLDEGVAQDLGDGGAARRVHLQHLGHEPAHVLGVVLGDGEVLALGDLEGEDGQRVGVEGRAQEAHLEEDDPQRPDVGLEGVLLVLADLGRHVIGRPHHALGLLDRMLQVPRDPKVAQLHRALRSEEDVLRLQVAVDDLTVVDVLDSQAHLREPLQDLLLGERSLRLARLADALGEVAALGEGHHDVEAAVAALEGGEELDDEIAVQCLQDVRLPHRLPNLLLSQPHDLDLLQHALLPRLPVQRQVALPVRALTQQPQLLVVVDLHSNYNRFSKRSFPPDTPKKVKEIKPGSHQDNLEFRMLSEIYIEGFRKIFKDGKYSRSLPRSLKQRRQRTADAQRRNGVQGHRLPRKNERAGKLPPPPPQSPWQAAVRGALPPLNPRLLFGGGVRPVEDLQEPGKPRAEDGEKDNRGVEHRLQPGAGLDGPGQQRRPGAPRGQTGEGVPATPAGGVRQAHEGQEKPWPKLYIENGEAEDV